MEDILKMPAYEVVDLLRQKEVCPMELVRLALDRICEVDSLINAVPTLCPERAEKHALALEKNSEKNIPGHFLYGLPILVKDLTEVAGVRTTYGSLLFKNYVPAYSSFCVEMLEKNGAIVLGKTNTPEFGAGGNTFNPVFGKTRNPWDVNLTSGGSSGGSAAALASGQIWLATGNDFAGSLRTPAGFCSVVGFRPSPGRIAAGPGNEIFNPLVIEGPMGRCVKDVALMLDAQTGYHPGDPLSLSKPAFSFLDVARNFDGALKVAASVDLGGITPVAKEVRSVFRSSLGKLAHEIVIEEDCPDLKSAGEVFHILRAKMLAQRFGKRFKKDPGQFKPDLIWNIEKGMNLTLPQIGAAEQKRAQIYQAVIDFFDTYDLLICPTAAALPFDVNMPSLMALEETVFDNYLDWLTITFAISVTTCPCISIPCGFSESGLPVGVQIIGPPRRDDLVIGAAALFESIWGVHENVPIDPVPGRKPCASFPFVPS